MLAPANDITTADDSRCCFGGRSSASDMSFSRWAMYEVATSPLRCRERRSLPELLEHLPSTAGRDRICVGLLVSMRAAATCSMLLLNDCRIISYKQSCRQDLGTTLWRQESGSAGVRRPMCPGHVIHEALLRARPRFVYEVIHTRAVARQQQIKEAPRVRRQLLKHDPLQSTAGPGTQTPPPKVAGKAAPWRAKQVSRLGAHARRERKSSLQEFLAGWQPGLHGAAEHGPPWRALAAPTPRQHRSAA